MAVQLSTVNASISSICGLKLERSVKDGTRCSLFCSCSMNFSTQSLINVPIARACR
jgi:hypothetical protein